MQVSDLIKEIYYSYRGKGASRIPLSGSEKWNTALAIANRKQKEWARDSNIAWTSSFNTTAPDEVGTVSTAGTTALTGVGTYFTDYQVGDKIIVSGETTRTIDTITSDTALTVTVAFTNTASTKTFTRQTIVTSSKEYSLHRGFYVPSDKIIITTTSNDYTYGITKPQARISSDTYLYGRNPRKIAFYNDINTAVIGGVLKVAGYYIPNELVNDTDLVAVDDPNWLVYATAAELARNDAAKEDQFPNLLGMANDLYRKMINANNEDGYLNSVMPTNAPLLGDSTEDWEA